MPKLSLQLIILDKALWFALRAIFKEILPWLKVPILLYNDPGHVQDILWITPGNPLHRASPIGLLPASTFVLYISNFSPGAKTLREKRGASASALAEPERYFHCLLST
uniref:Uncharacterized protein n=1 Tax=Microcebus murinus TaxID=30608 RepID=A0A8C5YJ93_MICMU